MTTLHRHEIRLAALRAARKLTSRHGALALATAALAAAGCSKAETAGVANTLSDSGGVSVIDGSAANDLAATDLAVIDIAATDLAADVGGTGAALDSTSGSTDSGGSGSTGSEDAIVAADPGLATADPGGATLDTWTAPDVAHDDVVIATDTAFLPDGLQSCQNPDGSMDWACCEAQNWQPTPQCTPWGPPAPPRFDGRRRLPSRFEVA